MLSPPPLFILAPIHGLAPWVNAMLGLHPQLQALPGIPLLAQGLVRLPHRLELQNALIRTVAQIRWGRQDNTALDQARDWLVRQPPRDGLSLRLILASWAAPYRLVERSPYYLHPLVLNRIRQTFPDAYYLHLACHPLTQLKEVRRWQARKNNVSLVIDPAKAWLAPMLIAYEFLQQLPWNQRLTLRSEDLLKDPAGYLTQVAQWLGLNNDRHIISRMLHPECWPFAIKGLDWAVFSDDQVFLSNPTLPAESMWPDEDGADIEGITDEIRHYIRLLGYS